MNCVVTKLCKKCEKSKSISEFYEHHSWCKDCLREYYRDPEKRLKANAHGRGKYWDNHERELERGRNYKIKNKDKVLKAHKLYNLKNKVKINYQSKKDYTENPEKHKKTSRDYHKNNRKLAISAYGGKCQCCGETIFEFLCIDHIKGGGSKHRKEIKRAGNGFYVWLKLQGWPEGYRVLCHNCNLSKGFYGYCPHESKGKL